MMNKPFACETLIVDATFTGLGIASSLREDAIVIERTISPGCEFVNSFKAGDGWGQPYRHSEARALQEQMLQRNLMSSDGRVHLAPLHPLLCQIIHNKKLKVLFSTELISIHETSDGYDVLIYAVSGLQTIKTKQIIDTSSTRKSTPCEQPDHVAKAVGALLHGQSTEGLSMKFKWDQASVSPGFFESEAYLSFSIKESDDWGIAREQLYQFWKARSEQWLPWTIAAVADTFDITMSEGPYTIAENWIWLPSCAYKNGIRAYEAGLLLAEPSEVKHDVQ